MIPVIVVSSSPSAPSAFHAASIVISPVVNAFKAFRSAADIKPPKVSGS